MKPNLKMKSYNILQAYLQLESQQHIRFGYRPITGDYNKVYKKGKDPKSLVTIAFSGEAPYSEKDALALSALGEVATIKVIEKLREDESGIYGGGARGGMSKVPYGSYSFSISFPCGPENAKTH
jgi:zinc protease